MKEFVKKLLLLLLVLALACGICNLAFYAYMGRMTPAYTDRFTHAPERIQVANLGSSHGQSGFCYDHIADRPAVNLAFGSQSLQYDLRVLEKYIDRFEPDSVCYVPISYHSLLGSNDVGPDFLSLNQRYYYILPRRLILNFSWKEWLISRLPGVYIPNWLSAYWKSDEFDEAAMQRASDLDVEADAREAIERHIPRKNASPQQVRIDDLIAIIRLCKEHGVTPVLVTTPFLNEYNALVPDEFLRLQQAAIDMVCSEEDVAYLDFSHDRRFADRYDLFLNCDHLNQDGALAFTDLLLSGASPAF